MGYWDTHPVVENPPLEPTFYPTFRSAWGYGVDNSGKSFAYPLNHEYFADYGTAQWIANRYGDSKVYELPFEGSGGPFQASANIFCTKLQNGRLVNCGVLAAYFGRNTFKLADFLVTQVLLNG